MASISWIAQDILDDIKKHKKRTETYTFIGAVCVALIVFLLTLPPTNPVEAKYYFVLVLGIVFASSAPLAVRNYMAFQEAMAQKLLRKDLFLPDSAK